MPDFLLQTLRSAARLALAGAVILIALTLYAFVRRPYSVSLLAMDGVQGPPLVNVALGAAGNLREIRIGVDGPYEVTALPRAGAVSTGDVLANMPIRAQGLDLYFGKTNVQGSELRVSPSRGAVVSVDGKRYAGVLRVVRSGEGVSALNELDLESYLEGVLGAEMRLDWNDAALEAQAIAARTYALHTMKEARQATGRPNAPIADDVSAQMYRGLAARTARSAQIVQRTRGMVLIHGGALIRAMFHAVCGGATEPGHLFFDVPDIAPLMGRPCGYCAGSPFDQWRAIFTKKELGERLAAWNPERKPLMQLAVAHATPSGRVTVLSFGTAGGVSGRNLGANDFRLAVGPDKLRSTWFAFEDKGAAIEFTGKGWGHGVGMCQYGAKAMGDGGIDCLDILRYYYPDADVVRLY